MRSNKKSKIAIIILFGLLLVGCVPNEQKQQETPESNIEKMGYSVQINEVDANIIITYACIGVKDDEIVSLYLDQIEQGEKANKRFSTNKEMGNTYGLAYSSNRGEWYKQVEAIENYISGNKMTIEEVNNIPLEKRKNEAGMFPAKGTDLEAACEIETAAFIDVINEAYSNLKNVEGMQIGVGENIIRGGSSGQVEVDFSFVVVDYRNIIRHADIKNYSINLNDELNYNETNYSGYEEFILGLSIREACQVETYDTGNGIDTAMPRKGTELSEYCQTDLSGVIKAMKDIDNRLSGND